MKHTVKNMLGGLLFLGIALLSLTGCYETHYYHQYHHHTRGWYDHRHQSYPAGVDFNVDVHN